MISFEYKDDVSPALKQLRKAFASKAKLRAAVRPAAKIMKMALSKYPVPKGVKGKRTLRGAIFTSGNLRKSSLIVANLRKTSFLVVGHRWGEIVAGSVVGSTKRGAIGFYGHMVDEGTNKRQTKSGKNTGRIRATWYTQSAMSTVQSQVISKIESGFLKLLDKEKQRAGLS